NVGKYLQAAQNGLTYATLRPSGRLTTTVTRSWTDTNLDFIPNCDLTNPLANNGGEAGGQISDLAFGGGKVTSDLDPKAGSGGGRGGDREALVGAAPAPPPGLGGERAHPRRCLTHFT